MTIIAEEFESTTDLVIEYLSYKLNTKESNTFKIIRLNKEDLINDLSIKIGNLYNKIVIESEFGSKTKLTDESIIWYRRGNFEISKNLIPSFESINTTMVKYLNEELHQIKYYIDSFSSLGGLNEEYQNNKISNLFIASKIGLQIPETLITTSKLELLSFIKNKCKIISKPIHHGHIKFTDEINNIRYVSPGTIIVNEMDIEKLEKNFYPSLFQEYVEKEFEIRVFFVEKKLYPMAIFSQNDPKTKIDFRNYNYSRPNRNVPFKFPAVISQKILSLLAKLKLSTGSIDFIYSKEKKFIFLEINPSGQFGWVSTNCNYYLEKKIANYLIKISKRQANEIEKS